MQLQHSTIAKLTEQQEIVGVFIQNSLTQKEP
jgi:hypothetical protein